jgi:hypothetical protein
VQRLDVDGRSAVIREKIEKTMRSINENQRQELMQRLGVEGVSILKDLLSGQNWFQKDHQYIASVIGGGKPCALANLSEKGLEFMRRADVRDVLRKLGMDFDISKEARDIMGQKYYSVLFYNVNAVRAKMNANIGLLRTTLKGREGIRENMSDIEIGNFIRDIKNDPSHIIGILLGYPAEAVKKFKGKEGMRPYEDWVGMSDIVDRVMAGSETYREEGDRFGRFAGFFVDSASINEGVDAAVAANIGYNTTMAALERAIAPAVTLLSRPAVKTAAAGLAEVTAHGPGAGVEAPATPTAAPVTGVVAPTVPLVSETPDGKTVIGRPGRSVPHATFELSRNTAEGLTFEQKGDIRNVEDMDTMVIVVKDDEARLSGLGVGVKNVNSENSERDQAERLISRARKTQVKFAKTLEEARAIAAKANRDPAKFNTFIFAEAAITGKEKDEYSRLSKDFFVCDLDIPTGSLCSMTPLAFGLWADKFFDLVNRAKEGEDIDATSLAILTLTAMGEEANNENINAAKERLRKIFLTADGKPQPPPAIREAFSGKFILALPKVAPADWNSFNKHFKSLLQIYTSL